MSVWDRPDTVREALRRAEKRPTERSVLMADPDAFDVAYVINPHMEGQVGQVDTQRAKQQWRALRDAYTALGFTVHTLPATPGLPDAVFCANPALPVPRPDGSWFAVLSQMHAAERAGEVNTITTWFHAQGIETRPLPAGCGFEGMGDALWMPGRRVLLVGHGYRTGEHTLTALAAATGVPIVPLRLVDPHFYHLDTCLAPLTEQAALWVPDAFTAEGRSLLRALWPTLIEVPAEEARQLLACNGHCPDGRHFLVQAGATETERRVRSLGLEVVSLDTSEFLKSGGSVFCMKLMLP